MAFLVKRVQERNRTKVSLIVLASRLKTQSLTCSRSMNAHMDKGVMFTNKNVNIGLESTSTHVSSSKLLFLVSRALSFDLLTVAQCAFNAVLMDLCCVDVPDPEFKELRGSLDVKVK